MSEHYWAQEKKLSAELETLLYGYIGDLLQGWQRKAIKRAIKLAKKKDDQK